MPSTQVETVLPPRDAEALAAIEAVLRSDLGPLALTVPDGGRAPLPDELRDLLTNVVMAMRRGQAITVAPHAMRLTTQHAADLLGVSRPTLVKLLEEGRIPYETPNRHRRVQLADLLTYQAMRRAERRETLRELTEDAQEIGTYERSVENYEAALRDARSKLA
ncbi:MAG: helix-turn-helix domain-containing protein [Acidothermaceae bacterium]